MTSQHGEVIERIDWAEGLATLRVAAKVDFEPGQFINVGLELGGDLVRRSYSLASAPGDPLELYLVRVEGGALTPSLVDLRVGDSLWIDDVPQGFFTIEYIPRCRDGWLFSTGTGLAPFLSMLRSERLWQRFERVVIVHGARLNSHLGYRQELERRVDESQGRLLYVPVVSREPPDRALSGRITDVLRNGSLEAATFALQADHAHVMLCGNPAMIEEMTTLLAERGLRRHRVRKPGHITIEKYW